MPLGKGLSSSIFNLLHLPTILALILAIIGGVKSFSSDSDKQRRGETLSKMTVLIFFDILIGQFLATFFTFTKWRLVMRTKRKLVFAVTTSVPFLFVRMIYSLIAVLNHN